MKKIIALTLCFLSFQAFSKEITVKVSGMVCSMCAQGIQKKFSSIPAVKDLKVDLDSKIVSINLKDGQDVPNTKIKELITEAGYNVASIERK